VFDPELMQFGWGLSTNRK